MNKILPLFSIPLCYGDYKLDTDEIESIKKELYIHGDFHDGLFSDNHNILLKYPNLLNVVHTHIKTSLYDENSFNIVSDMKYKILASWVNKHPPKHAGRRHAHLNSMFTGVLYIDIPDDSGEISFGLPVCQPTWITGTINPKVNDYNIYNSKVWTLPTNTGMCIFFPSHLEHWVSVNESNHDRYTIAFNVMLEGKLFGEHNEVLNIKVS